MKVNENFKNLGSNYIFSEINKRVSRYRAEHPRTEIIGLGIGDVSLPLCECVTDALVSASEEMGREDSFRGYPPENGYPFLREAISGYYKRRSVNVSADEITVSDGAKCDLGAVTDILVPDAVCIPSVSYPVYSETNIIAGNRIIYYDGLCREKNAVIYICSPDNPTGEVLNREALSKQVRLAADSGSVIIFDASYEAYIRDAGLPRSVYEIEGARKCAVELCSFSKGAGFTGIRCSWSVFPDELAIGGIKLGDIWKRRNACKFNGVSYISQRAACAAFSDEGIKESEKMTDTYLNSARILGNALEKAGFSYSGGRNSPYLWVRCPDGVTSWELFDRLLCGYGITVTPGIGFGRAGDGFVRISALIGKNKALLAAGRLEGIR